MLKAGDTCCPGCGRYLWSPIPLVTTASGRHMIETNPEPAAVHASGRHATSTAALGGETSAELPSGAAREESASITADSARSASPARAVGESLLCSACICTKGGGRVQQQVPSTLSSRQQVVFNSCHIVTGPPSPSLLTPSSPHLLTPDCCIDFTTNCYLDTTLMGVPSTCCRGAELAVATEMQ